MVDRVFGYGSLVNRATHGMAPAVPARLEGWRRVWVHVPARPVAFLSVRRAEGAILGLAARVAPGDWPALDAREAAYARHPVIVEGPEGPLPAPLYAVPDGAGAAPRAAHPILLSYLDTVVQGFRAVFGPDGAAAFFATTDGWDAPVLDDRAAPRYPRAQRLTGAERALVDRLLAATPARVVG